MVLGRSRQRFSVSPRNSAAGTTSRSCTTGRPCRRSRFSTCSAGSPGRRPSACRRVVVEPNALEAQQFDLGRLAQAVAALDVEELEQEAVAGVRGDEGAAALAPHQDVLGHQFVDRAPQRAHRHAEAGRQVVSLGSAWPGATTPSSMARSSARLTARYSGMPRPRGRSGRRQGGGRPAAAGGWQAWPILAASPRNLQVI
jgi:hypothetical protein